MRANKPLPEIVTVQGLPQICDAHSCIFRRLIWFLIFCGGLGFTSFNIYKQVSLYLSAPVNVRVDQVLGNTLLFPTITLCNNNFAKGSQAAKLGMDGVFTVLFPYTDFDEHIPDMNLSQLDVSRILEDEQLQLDIGHIIEATIVKCDWESTPCRPDDFIYKETDMGKCSTFNVNGSLLARKSGRSYGLRLVLNVQEEEYTRSIDGYLGTGFMIAVHAPEVPPIMSEVGIALAPGFQHFMGIGVKKVAAKEGVGGCGKNILKYYPGNYSRDACRQECEMDFIISKCNCKDISNPSDVNLCTPQQYTECLNPAVEQYMEIDTGCEAGCPEPCSYTSFTTQHSSSPLTRDYITAYTKAKGETEEYWRRNLVILEIYLSSMTYEHMEKQLGYEILDLFCDIGGALGLLLGASLLTVLEVFDFLCITVFSAVFEKNKVLTIDPVDGSK